MMYRVVGEGLVANPAMPSSWWKRFGRVCLVDRHEALQAR
ncbi:hypothetical protein FTUN_7993 [Frigoriglobus tundricola]|uniref:Uncharacterized protein n=1 Tax=Frigoriglobus tundricola TaxID=2774151 RepID=A0A6M5Z4G7_9BACT|nr:hypothetical protein FTUN_7993 [Frigoriglobus tundricola]